MKCILKIGTTERRIPDYSDATLHVKKRASFSTWPMRGCAPTQKKLSEQSNLNFEKKSFDTTNNSSEDSAQTEDVFSPEQTDAILHDLRTFARPAGLKITNCIFRRNHVEICYLFDDIVNHHNKDELKQLLAEHLKINSKLIKLTKLRAKPIYKETTLRPGDTATIHPRGLCKIGAFVEVEGKS